MLDLLSLRDLARVHGSVVECKQLPIETRSQFLSTLLNDPDRPKILGKVMVDKIIVGQSEIAALSPSATPRVAHNEAALRILITHRENGMTAA
jgi:hypothetical protein